ncbi:aldehyde-activating protein [Thalassomonas viridans]|uniref:Aldehyde-activating protein n=1 Tax=Thalassomonas viridans TaxID=137584 RepID=A0AAF0C8D3_9GAMM|nr:hypothetical protein [Thalassomonas viridans]WDE06312.1 aldehyde-activating protein [Thalassomonas viridans]
MTFQYPGKCSCGNVEVTITLPEKLAAYAPRACDCDFCTARNIQYLSHPDGSLVINSATSLEVYRQGSNQADFLACNRCDDVIAASLKTGDGILGALNATLLSDYAMLKTPEAVSPKLLSAGDKVNRWRSVWLKVKVNEN